MENNWTITETKELFDLAYKAADSGKGLSFAFNKMAAKCGRSLNSVRNYYYSQLKMFTLIPGLADDLGIKLVTGRRAEFETFSATEIDELLAYILTEKAKGVSVRAAIATLSGQDAKKALRLQNKYRSMLAHHPTKVTAVMDDLARRGVPYFNPYKKAVVDKEGAPDNIQLLTEYISRLDEGEAGSFLSLIKKLM